MLRLGYRYLSLWSGAFAVQEERVTSGFQVRPLVVGENAGKGGVRRRTGISCKKRVQGLGDAHLTSLQLIG